MGTSIKMALLPLLLLWSSMGFAQSTDKDKYFPMSVSTASAGDSVASAPASGMVTRSGKDNVIVRINNSCFPTNLRGIANPLAPSSIIQSSFKLVVNGKTYSLSINYPAGIVTPEGVTGGHMQKLTDVSLPAGSSASLFGNTVVVKTAIPSEVFVDETGNITMADKGDVYLSGYAFNQQVMDCEQTSNIYGSMGWSSQTATKKCGEFMGKDGPLTASLGGISVSSDRSTVDINVSFPGQTGFCGGYWSPLMVFFDEARPRFDASSDFPLNPFGKTMWPEANSPGWFVALDRDGQGKIEKKEQLFGDNASIENGFEALRKLDSNKDGVIDKRDKDFKKLVLWRDTNADGVSQKGELIKLSKKIEKISLNYEKGHIQAFGKYAEARERAKFWYREKGKLKTGDIVDIWLAPAETRLSQK